MKVLVKASGDRILGFTMIGSEAGEVIAVVQMLGGLPYTIFRDAILAHPTMAEGSMLCLQLSRTDPLHPRRRPSQ
jgi:pyruvate/2-oxoglutarate dehydrogenase complex dihydrolipoamide dehydrogenase (E3) component